MRFEEAFDLWQSRTLTQEEAAQLLGVCERTFRRYVDRFEEDGLEGLIDKRMTQVSHLKAPVDEVMALAGLYKERYDGWNVKHFYEHYRDYHGGHRSYTWVKSRLQEEDLVKRGKLKGAHRKRRDPAPIVGLMIHQDASTHEWVSGQSWDLVVTMDDANNEIYSAFFVAEEGTWSSFRGVSETIKKHGIFSSFYSDRGSHYWHTPVAGGGVDKDHLTQFGRAMQQLGVEMIAAFSPEARGRSERMFKTLQGRLPNELALAGITDMDQANEFLAKRFLPRFNKTFKRKAREAGSAFVPILDQRLDDILCLQCERSVRPDNCVSYQGLLLQIPKDRYRAHYRKAKVRVHEYPDGTTAIFYGPRKLASYDPAGDRIKEPKTQEEAA